MFGSTKNLWIIPTLPIISNFSAILVLHHPTLGYSEIHFYFELSEIAKIHASGIIKRWN